MVIKVFLSKQECLVNYFFPTMHWVLFMVMWLLAVFLFIPQAIQCYSKWKKSARPIDLSVSIALVVGAFFLFAANFVMFIKIFINGKFNA